MSEIQFAKNRYIFYSLREEIRRHLMKNKLSRFTVPGLVVLLMLPVFMNTGCAKGISSEELKASIELVDIDTRWEKKYYQPWPPKLTLVPAISFKVKNIGPDPLRYVYFNGIFKFEGDKENLGDNFVAGIRGEAVMPGELSATITLQSFQGVEGNNLAHFKNNPAWKTCKVRIFVKSTGAEYIPIEEYEISRNINFKEPEPVGMEPKKKEETKK